jgi:hypothetical protein
MHRETGKNCSGHAKMKKQAERWRGEYECREAQQLARKSMSMTKEEAC